MKDTNPKSYYQGYVEVFGKEAADKMVESSIKRTEAERWEIMSFTPQKNETKKFEYAREHSDDGTFFILTRENTYPLYVSLRIKSLIIVGEQIKMNCLWNLWKII